MTDDDRRRRGALARRAPAWRGALAVGVGGYFGLFPGTVLAAALLGVESEALVLVLALMAFGGLLVAVGAARTTGLLRMRRRRSDDRPPRRLPGPRAS